MKLGRLINHLKCAFIADENILDKHTHSHWMLVDEMVDALYEIWGYSKNGNAEARDFMHSELHDKLVQFRLDFVNDDIPSLHKRATYRAYKDIMKKVNPLLHRLRKEMAA